MKYLLAILLALSSFASAAPLHSNPMSPNALWMDGRDWTATPDQIYRTWSIVANLYKPFNVDVIANDDHNDHSDNPGDRPNVARVIIGGISPIPGAAGQSVVGYWTYGTLYQQYGDAFTASVYADSIGNDPTLTGVAVAHEAGHLFGEFHTPDGVMAPYLTGIVPDPAWPAEVNVNGVFQDTYTELLTTLGPNPTPQVPETSVLWVGAGFFFFGRRRRVTAKYLYQK